MITSLFSFRVVDIESSGDLFYLFSILLIDFIVRKGLLELNSSRGN